MITLGNTIACTTEVRIVVQKAVQCTFLFYALARNVNMRSGVFNACPRQEAPVYALPRSVTMPVDCVRYLYTRKYQLCFAMIRTHELTKSKTSKVHKLELPSMISTEHSTTHSNGPRNRINQCFKVSIYITLAPTQNNMDFGRTQNGVSQCDHFLNFILFLHNKFVMSRLQRIASKLIQVQYPG